MARTNWELIIGPEGRKELLRFQLQMITRRIAMGWDHKDLKKAITDQGYGFSPESGSLLWQMADTQTWCRILGGKLAVTFPGVPEPDTDELDLIMGNLAAVFKEDELDRYKAVRYLGAARVKAGIDSATFGQMIGMTSGAVTGWEQNTENPMIPSLFRHAIALGGTVHLNFEEVTPINGVKNR